jgi:hypothetical protein
MRVIRPERRAHQVQFAIRPPFDVGFLICPSPLTLGTWRSEIVTAFGNDRRRHDTVGG